MPVQRVERRLTVPPSTDYPRGLTLVVGDAM